MSILIKGLKLPPVGIRQCIVSFVDNCLLITDVCGKILFEGEYIEVPTPHGRLIDTDILRNKLERHRDMCGDVELAHGIDVAIRILNNAPTIIEAEVALKGQGK